LEDFTYLITVGEEVTFHVREIKPKDFYYAQILRQKEESFILLIQRLLLNPDCLDSVTISESRAVFKWISESVLQQNVLTVENWLEVAFHLCKQRWESSLDWLEEQPMSKIQTMIQIVKNHADEQEKAMKKSAKKK
jgi:hypothetical protein